MEIEDITETDYSAVFVPNLTDLYFKYPKQLSMLSDYLKISSQNCTNVAMNNPISAPSLTDMMSQITPGVEIVLILVLPKVLVQTIVNSNLTLSDFIQTLDIKSTIVGHCYAEWSISQNICAIWDVCLHQIYMEKSQKFKEKTGMTYGSVLVECIIDSLLTHMPWDTKLWLCIDVANKRFDAVASLYCKYGFTNPYFGYTEPIRKQPMVHLPHGFIALSRLNRYIDITKIDRKSTFNDISFIIDQLLKIYNTHTNPLNIINKSPIFKPCSLTARFDISTAKFL